jgi:hypothetical protein
MLGPAVCVVSSSRLTYEPFPALHAKASLFPLGGLANPRTPKGSDYSF